MELMAKLSRFAVAAEEFEDIVNGEGQEEYPNIVLCVQNVCGNLS